MALTKVTVRRAAVTDAGTDFLTLEDGSSRVAQAVGVVDENGDHTGIFGNPVITQEVFGPTTRAQSGSAAVASWILATAATRLQDLRCIMAPGTTNARWLLFFNSTTVPVDTTVADWGMLVPAAGQASESFGEIGLGFDTGLTVVLSSTPAALTQVPSGECYLYAIEAEF